MLTKKKVLKETFTSPHAAYESMLRTDAALVKRFHLLCDGAVNALFLKMLSTVRFNLDCYRTNKFGHFLALLNAEGFADTTEFGPTFFNTALHRELQKSCVERKIAAFDFDDEAIEVKNQYLKIPETQIDAFAQNLLQFNRSFEQHLCVSTLFFRDIASNKMRLKEQKDFAVMKIRHALSRIVFIQELVERFGDTASLFTTILKAPQTWGENDATSLRFKHKEVFGQFTKVDVGTSAGLSKLLRGCLRPLVPQELYVKTQRGSASKKTRVREWALDETVLKEHRTVFKYRQPTEIVVTCEECMCDLLDCCCR